MASVMIVFLLRPKPTGPRCRMVKWAQDAVARAVFSATVHHSRSSIIILADASRSAKSRIHIAALKMRPEGRGRDVDRRPDWSELKLYRRLAELLNATCARRTSIAHESDGLALPLWINPVEGVLEHRRRAIVIFWCDDDEAIRPGDFGSPFLYYFMLVWRPSRRRGRNRLIEEGHWKVPEIEQARVNSVAILEMLKNPERRLFRKATLTDASDDNGNYGHVLLPGGLTPTRYRFVSRAQVVTAAKAHKKAQIWYRGTQR